MKRLLIVADHSLVVHAIRLALRQTAGFQVVGFIDGRQTVRDAALIELRPDVVLVDDMQDARARARRACARSSSTRPRPSALLLTAAHGRGLAGRGLRGRRRRRHSPRAVHPVALGTLLREIVQGNVVQRSAPQRARPREPRTARSPRASWRSSRLAAQGFTNGRIARELWVTEQTVKFHLSNTYRKLGVANRTEASRYAHMHDLVVAA